MVILQSRNIRSGRRLMPRPSVTFLALSVPGLGLVHKTLKLNNVSKMNGK
jgi:hypothetical protein